MAPNHFLNRSLVNDIKLIVCCHHVTVFESSIYKILEAPDPPTGIGT